MQGSLCGGRRRMRTNAYERRLFIWIIWHSTAAPHKTNNHTEKMMHGICLATEPRQITVYKVYTMRVYVDEHVVKLCVIVCLEPNYYGFFPSAKRIVCQVWQNSNWTNEQFRCCETWHTSIIWIDRIYMWCILFTHRTFNNFAWWNMDWCS